MVKNYEDAWMVFYRVMGEIKKAEETLNGGTACFYSGFRRLDELTGGFRPGELVLLASRPSMGKTALALNIVHDQVVSNNKKMAYISLEERSESILKKLLVIDSHIDSSDLRAGLISYEQMDKLLISMKKFGNSRLLIGDDPGDICEECRILRKEYDIDGIIVDYIQLAGCKRAEESDEEESAEVLRKLKKAALDMEIPIIVLSQLSRSAEMREDKRPRLSDIKEGRKFTDIADSILFLYRDGYYNENPELANEAEVIIAKHIAGKTGRVRLLWDPRFLSFYDNKENDEFECFPDEMPFN